MGFLIIDYRLSIGRSALEQLNQRCGRKQVARSASGPDGRSGERTRLEWCEPHGHRFRRPAETNFSGPQYLFPS
jgi:hypothetical protein